LEGTNEMDLIKTLGALNRWWTEGKVADVEPFKRLDYDALEMNLLSDDVIIIVGSRQVGKSTLMYQLIQHLLKSTTPKRILYIEGDNFKLNTITKNMLEESLSVYQTYILKESLEKCRERVYIFIDEVQKIEKWATSLKNWHGTNKKNIKFIISGSSSTKIMKDCEKILVGRYMDQIVVPFKFLETVRYFFHKQGAPEMESLLREKRRKLRDGFMKMIKTPEVKKPDIHAYFNVLKSCQSELGIYEKGLSLLLNQFFVQGGYPRVVIEEDKRQKMNHLRTIINGVIDTDLAKTYSLRKEDFMKNLLVLLAHQSSKTLNIKDIQNTLGEKSQITVTKYLHHLRDGLLVYLAQNISLGKKSRIRKIVKKAYINDIGIRNYLVNLLDDSILTDPAEMGFVAETVAFNHCIRFRHNITGIKGEICYWKKNGNEVDVVIPFGNKLFPIEIKYRNHIDSGDFSGINAFIESERNSAKVGFIISKNQLELRRNIIVVPMLLFLLIC